MTDLGLAGARLRQLRVAAELTLQQAEAQTARHFGEENRVRYQQISRIEKGQLDKPPVVDLIRLGAIYGLTTDDIGELFGLWPRSQDQPKIDERLQRAITTASTITTPSVREEMLSWIEFAVMQAQVRERQAIEQAS
jgi:transcriptional regulator with XRE-family HTH domain